jgi:PepB aminopeptidase
MTQVTQIRLSFNSPHQDNWQADNLLQFSGNDIEIYLASDEKHPLLKIQQAGRKIETLNVKHAQLVGDNWLEENQWAFALGFTCVDKLTAVTFTGAAEQVARLTNKLAIYGWARDLVNQTPAQLYPEKLAQQAVDYLKSLAPNHVQAKIISGEDLLAHGWTGIYHVGKASVNKPCLLELDYNPTGDENAPVMTSLVGKGITFDSGGYSLKSSVGMFDMKCDMGGAAVVTGALALAIKNGLKTRVKLFLCCAENLVSGDAYKLSDILTYKNGVTVEIANTDAEGRVVLADGLLAASETGSRRIINAATLTGAAVNATGGDYIALFALDQQLVEQAKQCAAQVNELVWQLPLETWHQDKCPSAFADTANSRPQPGGGVGGASNAAGFLSRFVPNNGKGWLHCDLASIYNSNANNLWAAGATCQGIATLANLLEN